jgi:hypothetical protein
LKTSAACYLLLCCALASVLSLTSAAQEAPRPDATAYQQPVPADQSKDAQNIKNPENIESTSHDRLFFALPNFLTLEYEGKIPPLTTGQKFKVVARGSFDFIQVPWYAILAGISQAQNGEPGYGQGLKGYGKRYASAFADGTIENFMAQAVLPTLLRQDPRFFQMSQGGFWHRTGYAVSRIFMTRADSGNQQFNFSEIFGSGAAAAISTYSYHPSVDRTLSKTARVWGTQVGYDSITLVVKEFWPDLRRKLKRE